jgi:hypothetical protein
MPIKIQLNITPNNIIVNNKRRTTIGIANRAMNLMQRLVQEINTAKAFASVNNKNLN